MRSFNLRIFLASTVILSLLCAVGSAAQESQIKSTYVRLGNGVPGVFYEPANPGPKAQIAMLVMHSSGDYLNHSACTELPKRGYRVLCANTSFSKAGTVEDGYADRLVLDVKSGVAWLRKNPNVKKVVLFGHSGGGSLMSTYQFIAEGGAKACQGPEKIAKCSDAVAGLPPADGVMLVDSNWGTSSMTLFSVDPAITSEQGGMTLTPDLDLLNPKNGFNPDGNSDYSPEFIRKWETAVGTRNNQIIKTALERQAALDAGKGFYVDDEPFNVPGANFKTNLFIPEDNKLMSHTRNAWPLIHADGSITTEIVHTVRVPENPGPLARYYERGTLKTSVRHFLTTYAIRTTDDFSYDESSVHGVDWTSSYSVPAGNAEGITRPMLIMGMTGHWEFSAAETIYEHAKAQDKTLAYVEGASHGYSTCKKCEKTPGEFGDTMKTTYDYVDKWLSKPGRFE